MSDEKRSKGGHRDHDHCNGSFGLKPEYSPRRVNLTVVDVATSYPNYCGDHRKDTETQNPPKCKLSPQANLDVPEQDYRNRYDCYRVNHRSKVFPGNRSYGKHPCIHPRSCSLSRFHFLELVPQESRI